MLSLNHGRDVCRPVLRRLLQVEIVGTDPDFAFSLNGWVKVRGWRTAMRAFIHFMLL
jgi:hypothetical protein